MSSFDFTSKWAKFKGHIPSHFGVAAVIAAVALLVVACTGLLAVYMGHGLSFIWGDKQIVTTPPATRIADAHSQLDTRPEKKPEAMPPTIEKNPEPQPRPLKEVAPKIIEAPSVHEAPNNSVVPSTPTKPKRNKDYSLAQRPIPKNPWGNFTLEIPEQGDPDLNQIPDMLSYERSGLRFFRFTLRCDPKGAMPEACYLPQDQRPMVRGW